MYNIYVYVYVYICIYIYTHMDVYIQTCICIYELEFSEFIEFWGTPSSQEPTRAVKEWDYEYV